VASLATNGELSWTCPEAGQSYRVEWAPGPTGPWRRSWDGLGEVMPGAATGVTVQVPMFYRVVTPAAEQQIELVTAAAAGQLIRDHAGAGDFAIIDIRTTGEFGGGHIAGAVQIDYYGPTFAEVVALLPRDRGYVVYCRSGGRSAAAVDIMRGLGFHRIWEIQGGFTAFQAEPANADLVE
jgi:rhodanese-related sulfurtransferase